MSIHQRKRNIPKAPQVAAALPVHEQRRKELHAVYPAIPITHIFVDPGNGVVLFKNLASGGWCSRAETVLHQYVEGEI